VVLTKPLEENISNGFICQSSTLFAAPVLFAKKPEGGLRFSIKYQDINSKMIKNRYHLPLILNSLNRIGYAGINTKLDVRWVYNLLRVNEGDEHKIAFPTRYWLFETTVMQFGTTNAPADFQGNINNAISEALDDIASAYLDDVLINIDSEKDHVCHGKWVMQRLLEAGLYLKPEKCKFHEEPV
jgi:hypothetical protein